MIHTDVTTWQSATYQPQKHQEAAPLSRKVPLSYQPGTRGGRGENSPINTRLWHRPDPPYTGGPYRPGGPASYQQAPASWTTAQGERQGDRRINPPVASYPLPDREQLLQPADSQHDHQGRGEMATHPPRRQPEPAETPTRGSTAPRPAGVASYPLAHDDQAMDWTADESKQHDRASMISHSPAVVLPPLAVSGHRAPGFPGRGDSSIGQGDTAQQPGGREWASRDVDPHRHREEKTSSLPSLDSVVGDWTHPLRTIRILIRGEGSTSQHRPIAGGLIPGQIMEVARARPARRIVLSPLKRFL